MAIGVDFGTTNSSIVFTDPGGTRAVVVGGARDPYDVVLRTAVFLPEDATSNVVVGADALGRGDSTSGVLLTSFKPKLAKERLRENRRTLQIERTGEYDAVGEGDRLREVWSVQPRYDEHSRKQIVGGATAVLERLLGSLMDGEGLSEEEFLEEPIYLGVPVGYGPTARRRLIDALQQTGFFGDGPDSYRQVLSQVRFAYEPHALLMQARASAEPLPETVLLFDFGGGTLDLALWQGRIDGGNLSYRELALGGLGWAGDRLDERLQEHLSDAHPEYRAAVAAISSQYDRRLARMRITELKELLSTEDAAPILEPGAPSFEVTVDELEFALRPALEEIEQSLVDLLRRGGLRRIDVDRVVMAGGSSLLPCVQDLVWRLFPAIKRAAPLGWPSSRIEGGARSALTAIASGLADLAFTETVSQDFGTAVGLPGDVVAWCEEDHDMQILARAGEPVSFTASLKGISGPRVSVALYERITRDRFAACLPDLRLPAGSAIQLEARFDRYGAFPVIRVLVDGVEAGAFDVSGLPDDRLVAFLTSDCEWLDTRQTPRSGFLSRRLRCGDTVTLCPEGKEATVTEIRYVPNGEQLEAMRDWSLQHHRVLARMEDSPASKEIRRHGDLILY